MKAMPPPSKCPAPGSGGQIPSEAGATLRTKGEKMQTEELHRGKCEICGRIDIGSEVIPPRSDDEGVGGFVCLRCQNVPGDPNGDDR